MIGETDRAFDSLFKSIELVFERAKQRSRLGELSGLHGDQGWGELLAIIDLTDEKSED